VRLAEPALWGNLSKGYNNTSRYEVWLEQFDPKFFNRLEEEFLSPPFSSMRYQWGMSSLKPKIVIKMDDEHIKLDEYAHTQKDRGFELSLLGLQKSERSETSSQSYEVEYTYLEHFNIRYVKISGRRRIERYGHIIPSEVQPFLPV